MTYGVMTQRNKWNDFWLPGDESFPTMYMDYTIDFAARSSSCS